MCIVEEKRDIIEDCARQNLTIRTTAERLGVTYRYLLGRLKTHDLTRLFQCYDGEDDDLRALIHIAAREVLCEEAPAFVAAYRKMMGIR